MIINSLDLGPYLADLDGAPLQTNAWGAAGQTLGTALVYGSRTIVWATGSTQRQRVETVYVEAPSALGGAAAGSPAALRTLVRQLQELGDNPDMNPVYIQWRSGRGVLASDPDDGWWVIESVRPDMSTEGAGWAAVEITVSFVASASPASLGLRWSGGALVSTYAGVPVPTLAYPVGSTGQVPTTLSRTGGEGAVPLSVLASGSTTNPALFVRPGAVAGLFVGGVRVYDTISTATNPVPAAPGFIDVDWVQVYGTQHDFVGDCIVTNGLVLLLLQRDVTNQGPVVYLWNTSLSTPGWAQVGVLNYNDSGFANGTIRELNLDRVGLEESRVRLVMSTSNGNYAMLKLKLQRGRYATYCELWPLTEANGTGYGLRWALQNATKIGYDESAAADLAVTANATLAPSSTLGFSASFGQTANGPLVGWLYQNAPSSSQGLGGGAATDYALGDANGPAQNSFRMYGFWAVPFATAPNLQAEAEGGTLGTGWTSIADANASAGNTAKCASGTLTGNADLWGTAFVPTAGVYDLWVRLRLTSLASATSQMQIGLWNSTDSVFVASTTYAPNAAALAGGTSYIWIRVAASVTPTAGKSMRVRAVSTATLTTDWFIDESALVPIKSATLGQGSFPGDLYAQWAFERETRWTRG